MSLHGQADAAKQEQNLTAARAERQAEGVTVF
jgi:hypothetical protein